MNLVSFNFLFIYYKLIVEEREIWIVNLFIENITRYQLFDYLGAVW